MSETEKGSIKEEKTIILKDKSNFKSSNGFKNEEKKPFKSVNKFDFNKKGFDSNKKFNSEKKFDSGKKFNSDKKFNSNKKFETKKTFPVKQEANGDKPVYNKKELKQQRKQKKLAENYDVSVNMKKIWETLRRSAIFLLKSH